MPVLYKMPICNKWFVHYLQQLVIIMAQKCSPCGHAISHWTIDIWHSAPTMFFKINVSYIAKHVHAGV